jgi:pilus assembly protein TadC
MKIFITLLLWIACMTVLYFVFTRRSQARIARERIFASADEAPPGSEDERTAPFLEAWLARAGFRAPGSASAFLLTSALCLAAGLAMAMALHFGDPLAPLVRRAGESSAAMGSMLGTLVTLLPWVLFVVLALAPVRYVRDKRQKRVRSIDNELPIILELLATMSESGLGFDSSFAKILDHESESSPLVEELEQFQLESLAGVSRVSCFRRLARRSEVSSMTVFCSAMIQAEQVGAGFSAVLRTQAVDLRSRRRERALIQAQALPVKLVFPLVICFLPGIFIVTLGPAFAQFFAMAGGILGGS